MTDGISISWTTTTERTDRAVITLDQARKLFGLVGTPDELVLVKLRVLRRQLPGITAVTDELRALATRGLEKVETGDIALGMAPLPEPELGSYTVTSTLNYRVRANSPADAVERFIEEGQLVDQDTPVATAED
jgi:hypothetical protein